MNIERLNTLGVIQVECGAQFSLALTRDGEVCLELMVIVIKTIYEFFYAKLVVKTAKYVCDRHSKVKLQKKPETI